MPLTNFVVDKMAVERIVHIVDDDDDIRDVFGIVLEKSGYGVSTYETGEDFLAICDGPISGCLLLDVRLPGIDGLDVLDELINRAVELPTIIMTGYADVPTVIRAMRTGAVDFIEKPFSDDEVLSSISRALMKHGAEQSENNDGLPFNAFFATLTPREKEVIEHLVQGKTSKLIAYEMGVGVRTIETHRTHILRKSRAKNTAELVRLVLSAGLGD